MLQEVNDSSDRIKVTDEVIDAMLLAIPLALAVAGANGQISKRQGRAIEAWARANGAIMTGSGWVEYVLAKFIAHLIALFPSYHLSRAAAFGKEIAQIAPFAVRCNILELCMQVVRAGDFASIAQLMLLKKTAERFEIKTDRFRSMMERFVPITMCEVADMEICFGVNSEMDRSQVCRQLSKEYRKWNARVTSSNRQVRTEAERMLKLVARARKEY